MTFDEVLEKIQELLQRERRVSYRGLKRRFDLDDEYLEDLKEELIGAKRLAVDEEGRFLVWTGAAVKQEPVNRRIGESAKEANGEEKPEPSDHRLEAAAQSLGPSPQSLAGERRQLTVMFIDLVGSTALSQQLDPEEYHARVVAYQDACRAVIARYEGHVAQYLGDGILAYFGYPAAHEDDAARAVHSGLECVTAVGQLPYTPRLQVRIGVHTGPVVVGEIGAGERVEMLALGETPNLAARVQGVAEPDTVFLSPITQHLVQGLFECQDVGLQTLKGIAASLTLYRVIKESAAQSRFEAAVQTGLTPLVGRESEFSLLRQRWEQAKTGAGQVVLLSGEPGIGKSRLVQELKEQVNAEGSARIEFRCSPYHQNSAFHPIIEHLQRLLQFAREDSPTTKLAKLQQTLSHYRFPQMDTLPLLAALLSLPRPEGYSLITFSPQKQKEKTQAALVAWLVEEAERATVLCAWEDLHWADPSTLEMLTLLQDQIPTSRLLAVLTFRPEFAPPWGNRSHFSQLSLSRLSPQHIEAMVGRVTGGKPLPAEVVQQIVAKTDGITLFVEELTKTVVESGLVREEGGQYVGAHGDTPIPPLAIPSTLQDSLMARLDRLGTTKEVAQLGATLGREFSYDLLHAVSSLDEEALQRGLRQLVNAELIYQRGLPPQATYLFKHALVQDTAYQSLLKSRRQQLHQQIAQVLTERFPGTVETQPELLAHHYTEAGLTAQAIPYWQQAGQRAVQRSAHVEAIHHLTTGLALLKTLPDTPRRIQNELSIQVALGVPLIATKGYAASEVGAVFTRAWELCRHLDDSPELFRVLQGLWAFYVVRAEFPPTREIGEELQRLAQRLDDVSLILEATVREGLLLSAVGQLVPARDALKRAITLYDPQKHRSHALLYGQDPQVASLCYSTWVLWVLGYPEQAAQRNQEALMLARELGYPLVLAYGLLYVALFYHLCRDARATQAQAEALITLCNEQGFAYRLAQGRILQGWALAEQGQEAIEQMQQNLTAVQATGAQIFRPSFLAILAEGYKRVGQTEEGLSVVSEALTEVRTTGERFYEAELYRLKGELTLQQWKVESQKSKVPNPQPLAPSTQVEEKSEKCFLKAIEIAQKQQAKSLELRASTSLARLWQSLGKNHAARDMLSVIYHWFTEGFDTADLKEAKALLQELEQT